MYEEKWTLDKKPFENDQDLAFYFESTHHKEAQVRLLYGAEQKKPLCLLIGESGVGKTYVGRAVAAELSKRGTYTVARLSATGVEGAALIRTVALAFGIDNVSALRGDALAQLAGYLMRSAEKGKHPVLFLDNIECFLDNRVLDELRSLLDLVDEEGRPLMTTILCGHPRIRCRASTSRQCLRG